MTERSDLLALYRTFVRRMKTESLRMRRTALGRWNLLREKDPSDPYVLAWRALLELPDKELAEVLLDDGEIGDRLRQVSPFVAKR